MSNSFTLQQVNDRQLAEYGELIYERTGIKVSPQKKSLISNRLRRRLKATGLTCFDEYLKRLKALPGTDPEWSAFLQEITTHESYLYRDKGQWQWFREEYLPMIVAQAKNRERDKSLRIWSAACSTGDEPYTIASCIADSISDVATWKINILGTDIGEGALDAARDGIFGERAMRDLPADFTKKYFVKAATDSLWTVKPQLRKWLEFRNHNLLNTLRAADFDLVIIKNVLIYFDNQSKGKVMEHVRSKLKPGGYLVSGPAEGISDFLRDWKREHGWLHVKPTAKESQRSSK